ncbi:Fe-S cluster assembly ATPase SufC [Blattabacterium cuenoti]|uniref:Fe-S cluster assembly ATPase SufC n=1 Tax=Blattabacterium cuenoti TaxID=1653831 RepID=UPI00163D147A|nr:Fe-S cluster assembly ATPase SufC [Blattabacterium cuenoti]
MLLNIENLHVSIGKNKILKGINLKINFGETHVIMGPNGSGKSTLASIIAGKTDYNIIKGKIYFLNKDLLNISTEKRACLGIFLSFQNPVEIPGVSIINFIKTSINSIRKENKLDKMSSKDILSKSKYVSSLLNMEENFIYRFLNDGFSGGEKKRNEIFQMIMLNPIFSILDEIDSGLDIDAIKIIAKGINTYKSIKNSILIITHYKRLLNYINSEYIIHVLYDGKIMISGKKELVNELENKGYNWIKSLNNIKHK